MSYIYIASPYSSDRRHVRLTRFNNAMHYCTHLVEKGRVPFSPIVHWHPIAETFRLPLDEKFWRPTNELMVRLCGELHILMSVGWEQSKGVNTEASWADKFGKPVYYISHSVLTNSHKFGEPSETP